MSQVALMGFFIEIEGGFSASHRCRDKEQLFQPFSQKATLRCGLWKQPVWFSALPNKECVSNHQKLENLSAHKCRFSWCLNSGSSAPEYQFMAVYLCGIHYVKISVELIEFYIVHLFPIAFLNQKLVPSPLHIFLVCKIITMLKGELSLCCGTGVLQGPLCIGLYSSFP